MSDLIIRKVCRHVLGVFAMVLVIRSREMVARSTSWKVFCSGGWPAVLRKAGPRMRVSLFIGDGWRWTFIRDVLEPVQPCVGNGAEQQDTEASGLYLKRLEEVESVTFTCHEAIPNHLEKRDNPSHLRCIEP